MTPEPSPFPPTLLADIERDWTLQEYGRALARMEEHWLAAPQDPLGCLHYATILGHCSQFRAARPVLDELVTAATPEQRLRALGSAGVACSDFRRFDWAAEHMREAASEAEPPAAVFHRWVEALERLNRLSEAAMALAERQSRFSRHPGLALLAARLPRRQILGLRRGCGRHVARGIRRQLFNEGQHSEGAMNRIFRVIWCPKRRTWMPIPEVGVFVRSRSGRARGARRGVQRAGCWRAWLSFLVLFAAVPAAAQDLFWDGGTVNGGNPAANANGGTGTWDTTITNWDTAATGGADAAWVNGNNNAFFGGTGGTVTLAVPITAQNLNFTATGYSLTGGTLTLGGVIPTITSNTGVAATISSGIAGTAGLTKAGTGTLTLTGTKTFSGGINVNAGILSVNGNGALGDASNGVTMASGTQLTSTGALASSRVVTLSGGTVTLNGAGVGSARFTGAGEVTALTGVTLNNNANDYTGQTRFTGSTGSFTSVADLGVASALGAPTTAANGTILLAPTGVTQTLTYTGTGSSSSRNWVFQFPAGTMRLRNSGSGTLTLNGNISMAGSLTIQSLTFDAVGADIELLGVIDDVATKSVVFTGSAGRTITLGGANTWGGVTSIQNVTVLAPVLANIGVASSIGGGGAAGASAGSINITSNGTLSYTGSGASSNRGWTLNNGTLSNDGSGALTLSGIMALTNTGTLGGSFSGAANSLSGVISGAGALAVNTAGTWVLTNTNTYSGGTTISAGTLQLGNGGTSGSIVGNVVDNGVLAFNRSDAVTFGGLVSGSGQLHQIGTGTTILTSDNTYSGGTAISAGTLQLGSGGASGSIVGNVVDNGVLAFNRSNSMTFDGVVSGTGAINQIGAGTTILSGDNTYTGGTVISGGTLQLGNGGSSGSIVGDVVDNGALAFDRSDVHSFSGIISGSGTVTQAGPGTTILTGANTFAGGTFLDNGILQAAADGNLGAATAGVTFNGGILRLGASFDLAVTRAVTLNAPGGTIDTNGFNSALAPGINGAGALTKTGAGTLALTGANTYTGATTVAAGTLRVNGSLAASPVTANAGSTLGGIGTMAGPVTITSGATLDAGPTAGAVGTLTMGALTLDAGSQLIYDLGQANVIGGPDNDLVQVNGNLTLGGVVNVNPPGGSFANTLLPGSYRLIDYTGTRSGSATIGSVPSGFGGSEIQTVVPGQVNLIAVQNGVPVQFWDGTDTNGNGVIDGGTANWNNSAGNWTNAPGNINQRWIPGVGIFTGAAGTVTIAQPVSAMGLQFVTDGYEVSSGGHALTLVAQPDGSMPFIRVDPGATVDIGAPIAGTAGLMKADGGTLILSGTNTYSGGTVIAGGTLQLGDGGATGSIIGDLVNNGALVFDRSNTFSLGGIISGSGTVTQDGAGTTILTGANTYSGGSFIDAGALQVASDANLGASAGDLTFDGGTLRTTASFSTLRDAALGPAGGAFQVDTNTVLTNGGVISGTGPLVKAGTGTQTLTGANTYTGATTVAAGTLRVNGSLAAASAVTANAGSTLGGIGTIGGPVTIASGAMLDAGPSAGAVGTLTTGALTLNAGSRLTYDLGQANVVGNNNDLVEVTGNLALGGSVDVNAPGSTFANTLLPGSYRLINYAGTLSGSMTVGSIPADFGASRLQTVIPGQVNLIAVQNGVPVQFWDGADTTGDSAIDGGTEVWNNTSGNWTNASGSINQSWIPGVAIFTGTAGTVTMAAPITAMGLQFVTDGYEVTGAELTMIARPDGSMPFVRVDAGSTAEIGVAIAGADGLLKADAGTLILTGANRYTGGTTIGAGVLQLGDGGASGSVPGNIVNQGALAFNRGDSFTMPGVISGTGEVRQIGTGTTVLIGDSTYTGGTTITAGTLQLGNGGTSGSIVGAVVADGTLAFNRSDTLAFGGVISGTGAIRQIGTGTTNLTGDSSGFAGTTAIEAGTLAVNGRLCGEVNVRSGGRLEGDGTVCDTTSFGGGVVAPGNSIGKITVAGDYAGSGGTLEIETKLGGDGSPTDRLAVTGDTSGNSSVRVINLGGTGAQTDNGIRIVDVGGASAGSFRLLGDYLFQGEQAVVGGAYAYRLYKHGIGTPADGDWYLRSTFLTADDPDPLPLYAPGVPLYEAYAGILQRFNELGTLQQRVGNRSWGNGAIPQGADLSGQGPVDSHAVWTRIEAAHTELEPETSTTATDYDVTVWKLQAGFDGLLHESEAGVLIGGLTVRYGTISSDVSSIFGTGSIDATGYGFGGTLTWYGDSGFYVDAQAEVTWYDSDLESATLGTTLADGNGGFGYALGIEAGRKIALQDNWSLTPQAQLAYSAVRFDDFTDPYGAAVSLEDGDSLIGRLGIAANYENQWSDAAGHVSRSQVYSIANLYYDFLDGSKVDVSGTTFFSENQALWGGVGIGGSFSWADGRYSVYGEALARTSLGDFGDSYAFGAKLGFSAKW